MAEYGPEIVAMDFSRSVEHARRRLFEKGFAVSHRVHYLQGNILEFPLLPKSFDLVHTSGVLHHTPSTYRAFRSISRGGQAGRQALRAALPPAAARGSTPSTSRCGR